MNLTDAIASVADRPEPSEAQAKAGNYRKGPVSLHGMRISVENPQGSIRRGKSADGQPWASQLTHHYGYIRGAWGRDKDHLDIYLGPDAESADRVFVVDQMNPDNAKFDEHKVMLGFRDADDAREAYLDQFPEGWNGLGGVTELPLSSFKKWAFQKGRRVKPLSTEFAEATAQHYAGGGLVKGAKAVRKALQSDSAVPSTRTNFDSADKALSKLLRPSAVKEPGGNWMPDATAASITMRGNDTVNSWRDKQLERYIKNDLGTARDPLLKLEAEGRLHITPAQIGEDLLNGEIVYAPIRHSHNEMIQVGDEDVVGVPTAYEGDRLHKQLTGRAHRTPWEAAADSNIRSHAPEDAIAHAEERIGEVPAWLQKNADKQGKQVYDLTELVEGVIADLGFDHVLDYLTAARQAADAGDRTNPLVARGLHLTADQLSRTSVADAVAKTHEWNKLLDAQKLGDMNKGIKQVHWSDPDSGFQIVELDPEGLAAEGAAMKHCVGGYCSQVADGSSRILSVRDADGKPYATVEVKLGSRDDVHNWVQAAVERNYLRYADKFAKETGKKRPLEDLNDTETFEAFKDWMATTQSPYGGWDPAPSILQIQGPRNGEVDSAAHPALRALIQGQVPGLDKWGNIRQAERAGLKKTKSGWIEFADGGSVEPQATPITEDMYAEALARFPARAKPHMLKRHEAHNNRAASAEMPLTAARAALATVLGTPGDLESLVRMVIPGADEHAALPTTEFYREWLPTGGLDRTGPHGQLAEGVTDAAILATLPGPLTKLAGALRRGAAKAGTKAADAMDSWRDSYIPRRADIDAILDRAGNVLNPRPALPAYAEGGGVQAINDYSDAQYAAARAWATGKTGAEIAAKGTELGLTADQFAKVLNNPANPAITGADVAANGYGTTGGLHAAYMNAIYDAPGQFTNPTETIAAGTWQGGSGANATELANARAWSVGKTGAHIAAQGQSMGLTPEQMYQVFGQHQYGVGVGKQNMTWDGTQFVATPDTSYAPDTPQVSLPQVSLPQTPPGPQAPVAPVPDVYAPTAYLRQNAAGNQSWRMGAPGAQTGWNAAPRFAGGGSVDDPLGNWGDAEIAATANFKLPNANAEMNLSPEEFGKIQAYFSRPDYDHTGMLGTGTPYYTDSQGFAWMPTRTGATMGPEGYYDPGSITGYIRGVTPGTDQTLTQGNVLRGFNENGEHTGDWKNERESMFETLAPILSVVAPALGGIFAPALSSITSPITTALTEAGLPSWLANATPSIAGKGALSSLAGGNFWDGAASGLLGAGVDGLGLPKGASIGLKSAGNAALKGQDPLKAALNPNTLMALIP